MERHCRQSAAADIVTPNGRVSATPTRWAVASSPTGPNNGWDLTGVNDEAARLCDDKLWMCVDGWLVVLR